MALIPRRLRGRSKGDPARLQTGTSYKAKGQEGVTPADLNEHGSSIGVHLIDPVPALVSDFVASQTYNKMVRSDASVRVSLRAGKSPVLGGDYFMEPASDDPLDLLIAEFVEFNLFEGMTTPFLKTLERILKFFETPKGNSVFELVWEDREWAPRNTNGANRKSYTMLRKLAYRPPETITEYLLDNNGGPAGIKHNAVRSDGRQEEVDIHIDKMVIFVFDPEGGGITGTSILRSAYRNWFYKDRFYAIDGVQKERHGVGVPDIELQPGYDEKDKAAAIEMAKNLRTNENAYIVRNPKMKVSFAELSGNLVNALESAMHHDTMIMKNIMVQFLNAGIDNSGGGRSTSATALDAFLKAMEYIANSICDDMNTYVIPQLVGYNFKTDKFPKLKVKGIGQAKDLAMFAAAMNNLFKAKAIDFDEPTKRWIRQTIDAPRGVPPQEGAGVSPATDSAPVVDQPSAPSKSNGRTSQGFNLGKSPSHGD
jgi:hypothetical protein